MKSSGGVLLALLVLVAPALALYRAIQPGGDTICAHGGKYSFYVNEGTENKLIIELMGGGCCFNKTTCSLPIYIPIVPKTPELLYLNHWRSGIGSNKDPRNPVQDWTRIYVPYCTGDGHIGNNTADYGMHHKGLVNFMAVLDWVRDHFQETQPDTVMVTGYSAGSVGTYVLAPYVFDLYPDATHIHMGDSYLPFFGEVGYNQGFPNWGALDSYNPSVGLTREEVYPWSPLIAAVNTARTAKKYPNAIFSSVLSSSDHVQTKFYTIEGGGVEGNNWGKGAREAVDAIHDGADNYHSFIVTGNKHILTQDDSLYNLTSTIQTGPLAGQEISLADWFNHLASGRHDVLPTRVDCAPNC